MKTGIVILNYNTPILTLNLVEKCRLFRSLDLIVVVDNCSTDDSVQRFRKLSYNNVLVIENKKNIGYAKGNNVGLSKLVSYGCEICIVANPDIFFEEELILALKNEFNDNGQYGILTCSRVMSEENKLIRQYWNFPTKKELFLENFFLYVKLFKSRKEIYTTKMKKTYQIDVAPGAFFAIRSKVLEEVNYLDPNTFLYFEENCLAARLKKTAYAIGFIPYVFYTCVERKLNSTSKIQAETTFGRKCYCKSKEYFAEKYLGMNILEIFLLKILDKMYIFEKGVIIFIRKIKRSIK